MKKVFVTMLLFVIISVTSLTVPAFAASPKAIAASAIGPHGPQGQCQCVGYINNALLGASQAENPVTEGSWQTAESLQSPDFWKDAYNEGHTSGLYVNVPAAQPGDVIIIGHDAPVYAWNYRHMTWDGAPSNGKGWGRGAGHIGIVVFAKYYYDGYWDIEMKSANWSDQSYIQDGDGYAWSQLTNNDWADGATFTDQGCSNVTDSLVRVYNGPQTLFFREQ